MSVSIVLVVVMAVLYACGVYLLLERSLTRVLVGFLLVGNATNLLILVMAGRPGEAPFVTGTGAGTGTGGDGVSSDQMSDPLPQALILTAIVITFAVSAFLLALIYRSWRLSTEDNLEDDESDVAMRTGHTSIPGLEADASELDTEFGAPPA